MAMIHQCDGRLVTSSTWWSTPDPLGITLSGGPVFGVHFIDAPAQW